MKQNPFDISFGKKPGQSVERIIQTTEILETFTAENITQQVFLITGVRGSGKTVLMNTIANTLEKDPGWIVIRLNPDRDLLQMMGARLCADRKHAAMFDSLKLDVGVFGIGVEPANRNRITDIEVELEKMLKKVKKSGKRVLITIDEVTNAPHIRAFTSAFQIMIGQELPVFLLMTGLFDNFRKLQDEKSQTFLYRAPRLKMDPLNMSSVTRKYEKIFSVSREKAREMAELTKGFPFAFQALGYAAWKHKMKKTAYMEEYRQLLDGFVYEKIWSELSPKDRQIVTGIAHCPGGRIKDINAYLSLRPDEINQYRKRLIDKGIASGHDYGYLQFTLPLFDQFVLDR